MNIKIFECIIKFPANFLIIRILAENEKDALSMAKKHLDKETREEFENCEIDYQIQEYPLEAGVISFESSIRF
tara:strand:- start:374 stop:592 length:219 start_codon:yes stop_codon:yes gene_type:complete